jgi:hypothetical protein
MNETNITHVGELSESPSMPHDKQMTLVAPSRTNLEDTSEMINKFIPQSVAKNSRTNLAFNEMKRMKIRINSQFRKQGSAFANASPSSH